MQQLVTLASGALPGPGAPAPVRDAGTDYIRTNLGVHASGKGNGCQRICTGSLFLSQLALVKVPVSELPLEGLEDRYGQVFSRAPAVNTGIPLAGQPGLTCEARECSRARADHDGEEKIADAGLPLSCGSPLPVVIFPRCFLWCAAWH